MTSILRYNQGRIFLFPFLTRINKQQCRNKKIHPSITISISIQVYKTLYEDDYHFEIITLLFPNMKCG